MWVLGSDLLDVFIYFLSERIQKDISNQNSLLREPLVSWFINIPLRHLHIFHQRIFVLNVIKVDRHATNVDNRTVCIILCSSYSSVLQLKVLLFWPLSYRPRYWLVSQYSLIAFHTVNTSAIFGLCFDCINSTWVVHWKGHVSVEHFKVGQEKNMFSSPNNNENALFQVIILHFTPIIYNIGKIIICDTSYDLD